MFPDLSALTAGGFADDVPEELVELVKERVSRTNPLSRVSEESRIGPVGLSSHGKVRDVKMQ